MDEISKTHKKLHTVYRVCTYALLLFLILTVVAFIKFGAYGLIGVAAVAIMFFASNKAQAKYKAFYRDNVIKSAVNSCSFLDFLRFDPENGIDGSTVWNLGMLKLGESWNAKNMVTAEYNGVRFAESSVLTEETHYDGDTHSTFTVFRGRWLSIETEKAQPCSLQIFSKKLRQAIPYSGFGRVETQLPELEVYSDNPAEASRLLGGRLFDSIQYIQKLVECPFMFILAGSTVHIVLSTAYDPFEGEGKKEKSFDEAKQSIEADLHKTADIVGELKNTVLFG